MNSYLSIAALATLTLALVSPTTGQPTTRLRPETDQAFDGYVQTVEKSLESHLEESGPSLWIKATKDETDAAMAGEIVTRRVDTGDIKVPRGMIHDWIGAMYVEGATAEEVVAALQDIDSHKEYYPEVLESRLLSREGDTIRSFLRLRKQKVLTVVLDSEHEAHYRKLSEKLYYMHSRSTKIAQIKDAGSPEERELPVGEDGGFLWRLNAYWRIEETDEGTWVELRTLSLSRDIPFGLGWMIRPFITSIPRESLASTLQGTRLAVKQ